MAEYQSWKEIELKKLVPELLCNSTDVDYTWGVMEQADDNWAIFINTPGGVLTPRELKVIAQIMENGGIKVKLTGRQAPVLMLPEDKVDDALRKLEETGLRPAILHGSLRNIKACLGKKTCKNSRRHDVFEMARVIDSAFYGVKLPRDFKIGISGCSRNCAAARSQCLGLVDSRDGFAVYIGGTENEPAPVHGTLIASGVTGDKVIEVVETILKCYIFFAKKLSEDGIVSEKPRLYEIVGKAGVGYFTQAVKEVLEDGAGAAEENPAAREAMGETAAAQEETAVITGFTKENAFRAFIVLNELCIHCKECQRSKCHLFIAKESIVEISRTGRKYTAQIPADILEIIRSLPKSINRFDVFRLHEAFHTISEACDHCRNADHDPLCAVNVALAAIGCLIKGRDFETYMDKQKKLRDK